MKTKIKLHKPPITIPPLQTCKTKPTPIWDNAPTHRLARKLTFADSNTGQSINLYDMTPTQLRNMLFTIEHERRHMLEEHIRVFNIVDKFSSWH